MERPNISGYFTNNPYGRQLWDGRPGSVLTYPGSQSANNQLAILQSSNLYTPYLEQLISSAKAQQRYKDLASILTAGAIFDAGNLEMAERSQRIERRINETGTLFNKYKNSCFGNGETIWRCAEDRINSELENL